MKVLSITLLLVATLPILAAGDVANGEVVLQIVQRDFDRDGVSDRATLVRRGARNVLILEKGGDLGAGGRREILIHPRNWDAPELVYNESARYLMLGQTGVSRKAWILWHRGNWGMLADSRSGIDGTRRVSQ